MAKIPEINYHELFKFLPGRYALFLPDDPKFTIISANDSYINMINISHGQLIGRPLIEVFPVTSDNFSNSNTYELAESFRRVIKLGKPDLLKIFRYDMTISDRQSTVRYWQPVNYPIFDKGGKLRYILQASGNITHQKQLEDNLNFLLQASKELSSSLNYAKILKNIARLAVPSLADWCAIDLIDNKNCLKRVAIIHQDPKRLARVKALNRRQTVDMTADIGVPKVIRSGLAEFYPDITKLNLPADQNEATLKKSLDLDIRSVIIAPLFIGKKIIGAITMVNSNSSPRYTAADLDIAKEIANRSSLAMTNAQLFRDSQDELEERKNLQAKLHDANRRLENQVKKRTEQLEISNEQLSRSNQELQDFAYVASHDLQEPLRKIQAFGNLLEEEFDDQLAGGRDYLNRMRGAAARMNVLIEDLLSFSRVETQARIFDKVDLNTVAQEVISDLEVRLLETGGRIQMSKLPVVVADATQMRQLLQNLVANGLKFSLPGVKPLVKIYSTATKDKNGIIIGHCIFVEDNGIGFDLKYLDKIFTVFQRLHGRGTYEGTGIGLAVCRKITERHGGTITANSQPNHGATFIVSLPIKPDKGRTSK